MIVDHVSKEFPILGGNGSGGRSFCVFEDVSFSVRKGEFLTMIGHSGCGKSTLLNIMAGFDRPTTGGIVVDGKEVTSPGLDRMVVFQSFALMPWLTTFDNVRVAVRSAYPEWSQREVRAHTQKYVDTMGLTGAENKRPALLSGGMRQRVGLARAFSVNPKVLLLDEPFAQIDALTRGVIQEELMQMWESVGATVFMVTHDVDEAILLSDRIALMTNGPHARLAEIIDVDIPRPRTREGLIELEDYTRIRNHVLHFLISNSKPAGGTRASDRPEPARADPPVAAAAL
jgi:nitrate/nitrite transport system ATP-binding protein